MRKARFIENCRCYHLISRLAHQAFFLDDDEKTRAVELLRWVDILRKAVGIRNSTHFNRYYLSPLLEKGVIARTDPDHPQSPQQRYCLT